MNFVAITSYYDFCVKLEEEKAGKSLTTARVCEGNLFLPVISVSRQGSPLATRFATTHSRFYVFPPTVKMGASGRTGSNNDGPGNKYPQPVGLLSNGLRGRCSPTTCPKIAYAYARRACASPQDSTRGKIFSCRQSPTTQRVPMIHTLGTVENEDNK